MTKRSIFAKDVGGKMKRGIVVLAAALGMSMGMSVAAYAASWEHDSKGWWYITDDYKFLRQEARERVTLTTGSIDELKDDRAIYLINAQQVKDYCKQHSNVIIYNFSPSYIMNKNLNANDFVDMCKANGVNALPIANSYLGLDKVRKLGVPVLMIRHQPYKTNKWRSYTKLFYKDVTNSNKRINNSKRFFSFKNGVYIGNFSTYEEALKSLQ